METDMGARGTALGSGTAAARTLQSRCRMMRRSRTAARHCAAVAAGAILLAAPQSVHALPGIEFGINHGARAFDGVCDDPRFMPAQEASQEVHGGGKAFSVAQEWRETFTPEREGMTSPTERLFRDAADCHAAVEKGEVVLRDSGDYLKIARVEQAAGGDPAFFGEDDPEGGIARNGVCDDSRFMADPRHPLAVEDTALRQRSDATDCRRAFLMRHAWVLEDIETPAGGLRTIAFGTTAADGRLTVSATIPGS